MNDALSEKADASRRTFLKTTGMAVTAAAFSGLVRPVHATAGKSPVTLAPLPFPENGLEPHLSAKTIGIHYNDHHRKYVDQVVSRAKGTAYAAAPLETIITGTADGINLERSLHYMAILAWNHDFYWKSMRPKGGGEMPGKLKTAITDSFGSVEKFKSAFTEAAMALGSGWAWLVLSKGKLAVTYTSYHESPLLLKQTPLLTIDCWEHAYYLDYQSHKDKYIDAYLSHLVNWEFAQKNLSAPAEKAPADGKKETKK